MATRDVAALNAEILAETQKQAKECETRFAGDPGGELRTWLHLAARREALVSDFYSRANREYRLPEPCPPAGDVVRRALTLIWQQEKVHTRFIEVNLKAGMFKDRAFTSEALRGMIESKTLSGITSRPGLRNTLARLLARLGALFSEELVPDFVLMLDELELREFFLLCSVLETTARQSYARMEQLADILADRDLQLESLSHALHTMVLEETFHEQAFQAMAGWVVDGKLPHSLDAEACSRQLRKLLPRGARAAGDPESPFVLIDGGLGPLFEKYGMPVVAG